MSCRLKLQRSVYVEFPFLFFKSHHHIPLLQLFLFHILLFSCRLTRAVACRVLIRRRTNMSSTFMQPGFYSPYSAHDHSHVVEGKKHSIVPVHHENDYCDWTCACVWRACGLVPTVHLGIMLRITLINDACRSCLLQRGREKGSQLLWPFLYLFKLIFILTQQVGEGFSFIVKRRFNLGRISLWVLLSCVNRTTTLCLLSGPSRLFFWPIAMPCLWTLG